MGQSFSERHGFKSVRYEVQIDDFDDETRVAIWNAYYESHYALLTSNQNDLHRTLTSAAKFYWAKFLKLDLDQFSDYNVSLAYLKPVITEAQFWRSLDFIEMVVEHQLLSTMTPAFVRAINAVFEEHLVGYRLIGAQVTRLETPTEVGAVNEALEAVSGDELAGIRHSLENAIRLMSDRTSPDFANSVKESVSAVEGMVKRVTGDGVLSTGLKKLEKQGIEVHPALLAGWDKLYGWASSEDGVRHSATVPPRVDLATARFMLVTCAAFVTYLVDQSRSRT